MNKLEVIYKDKIVGHLSLTKNNLCAFEYTPEWLKNGFSISPFELPLKLGVFIAKPRPFDGGFGVFDDCLPDGWGSLILERYLFKQGVNFRNLSILDRLSLVGSRGRGALEFRPDKSIVKEEQFINFEQLALEAEIILNTDDYLGSGIEEFQLRGGSPGGTRPKIFINYEGSEYIVKFRGKTDPKNIGETEYKYSLLAKRCGVEMPNTKLFEDKYFGAERFDRNKNGKIHYVSVAGLIGADYRIPSIDYYHIFQLCANLTNNIKQMWKVYRLMVFNYLIDNKDDHAKNFGFLYDSNQWKFCPAFDLLPSDGFNGYRTSSINDKIEPCKEDIVKLGIRVGLDSQEAERIFEEMAIMIKG